MYALDRLTIQRFRGLQDLTLDRLGRINLLVGPNNSGKTSVLEAISIFCRPRDLRGWLDATWRREALDVGDPFFLSVEWMFPHRRSSEGPFAEGQLEEFDRDYDVWEGEVLPLVGNSLFLPVRTVTPVSQRVEPIQVELSDATLAGQKRETVSLLR